MTRVKSIAQRRHRKIKEATKGFRQARRRRIKAGKEALMHAGQYAYIGRKDRKGNMRSLWITRLSAAVKQRGLSYSKFIAGLKKENIELDRKILSDIAINDPDTFDKIVAEVKK
ncbi:MAG: 50S ribosomal protein L20 [Candidatus Woesebacteria bacterium GW2011_GWB1_38_5]|uniref:Large ribosomal subunit protein bL20 n=4 Tax=Candidatus Woeseibacteriota TaxID=1752722 RepID=A0A0G0MPI7_9BACT|nr:MAG: 50S ribosomal protein L20 [Candidatus Woesebacteria bacterium GW2011_GWD1_38_10]KKQ56964.1 MAG: 50S ribosomal protein L20 [Candidatus Woesebacteria bacterium GW2011_GWC1_38_13]KKQ75579.1 MAG: 50S ribosomal protein L20 [Candidatus Woesebacteria bacterium GW2011_GWB1_38_5]KKQ76238.1 MAG: 50S ribosomal protein L20 [Microgenomates group bacterium GW2011_GWF1_38_5]KKQ82576.1 MAG: 50S ribosomal protein L20 [Candidatus Woesebacteria bacterium GW2011_GWA1_38_8]